jgi:hypothetical protein
MVLVYGHLDAATRQRRLSQTVKALSELSGKLLALYTLVTTAPIGFLEVTGSPTAS